MVGQLGRRPVARVLLGLPHGARAARHHDEQVAADVHQPSQNRLAVLQLGPEPDHAVEDRPRQLARRPVGVPNVLRQRPEAPVPRPVPPADPARRIPDGVASRRPKRRRRALGRRGPGIDHGARHGQVLVHRLSGNEQAHDLAGPLEDHVDARVSKRPLQGRRFLAPLAQRVGRLVAPSAANLHGVVHQPPRRLAVPQLAGGRLQPDVHLLGVGQRRGQVDHRLHGVGLGGHAPQHLGHGVVLAHGRAPLHPLRGPLPARSQVALPRRRAERRQSQPPRVQRDQRQLQPHPFAPEEVLLGHLHVVEAQDAVRDAVQPHEAADFPRLHARPRRLHDERADRPLAPHAFPRRRTRHDHEELGPRAVGRPQLLAVQHVVAAVFRGLGERGHVGRVGADHPLGQRERRKGAPRGAWQVLALLLFGAEENQGRGHADRLVRGQERARGAAAARDQRQRAVVGHLGQPQAPVLPRNLDPERPQLGQALEDLVGNPSVAVHGVAVQLVVREPGQALQERRGASGLFRVLLGVRMDELQGQASPEELLHEAALAPLGFAGALGNLAGLGGVAHVRAHGRGPRL